MKYFFILASVMIFLFLVASREANAQKKKAPDKTFSVEMKRKLANEMIRNAYNPEFFKSCMKEAGGIDKVVYIKALSLNNNGGRQYLLTGRSDTSTCAFGARTPMYWIYEFRDGKFRMIADIGACDSVRVTSRRTNGYLDLEIGVWLYAGTKFSTSLYKYDGSTYECSNCGQD